MKKFTLAFFFLSASITATFAQLSTDSLRKIIRLGITKQKRVAAAKVNSASCLTDSTVFYLYQNGSNALVKQSLEIDRYNNQQQMIVSENYTWNTTVWVIDRKTNYTYNAAGATLSIWEQFWNGTAWENVQLMTFYYDLAGNITQSLIQDWNSTTNSWRNHWRSTYTYNSGSRLLTAIAEYWGPTSTSWENAAKQILTYSGTNIASETFQGWNLVSSSWYNQQKTTFTFNVNGMNAMTLSEEWSSVSNSWRNYRESIFTYNGTNLLTNKVDLIWDTVAVNWEPNSKSDVTYNSAGLPLISLYQNWNSVNSAWENSFMVTQTYTTNGLVYSVEGKSYDPVINSWDNAYRSFFTYDGFGNRTQIDNDMGVNGSSAWKPYDRYKFYFDCSMVGIEKRMKEAQDIDFYPNPATTIINVKTELEFAGSRILDISGKAVLLNSTNAREMAVDQLSQGLYFVQLLDQNNQVMSTSKFVKE